jgi:PAS domain S-box-containing protein
MTRLSPLLRRRGDPAIQSGFSLLEYYSEAAVRRTIRMILGAAVGAILGTGGRAAWAMPSAPAGVIETGAPSFVVLGPEELGLSSPPIDLHLLPDGRVLVVSQHELAFGDGVRWETFRAGEGVPPIYALSAVSDDGQVYSGIDGGFARIELDVGERWHFKEVAKLPAAAAAQKATLVSVATFPDHWYWYGGNGAIVSWRPGETPRVVGNDTSIDGIFSLGKDVFFSDQSSGGLFRLAADGASERVQTADLLVSEEVTCAIPFGPGRLLVGTVSAGLKIFDGQRFSAFGASGLLNKGHRITDLCSAGEGYFAASVDTVGIVFFNPTGRAVQVLDRSLDHRLARVQRLRYAREGVLWALLNDGVARVEFPSPVSHFEPLLASGLAFALPMRHAGELWILADGKAMHAVYSSYGRLDHFIEDTPPGRYLFTMSEVAGQLFASNDDGIYVYETTGWRLVLPGIVDGRVGAGRPVLDEIYYVARGEYGTIQRTGANYTARRIPFPDVVDSYNAEVDSAGIGWLELGSGRIGRLDPHGGNPLFRVLGSKEGLSDGWAEVYLLDGTARFHVANHLYRFDEAKQRFVTDLELIARFPQLEFAGGRPVTDSSGRLWYTAGGAIQVIDRSAAGGNRRVKIPPIGFAPTIYTSEDDGVIWMFEKRRLARIDLRQPQPPEAPLHALITSVEFPASNRQLYAPGQSMDPLEYDDNSLVFNFDAPANPFSSPVTFEILLEGAGTGWVSSGADGSATFNRLKEGDYVFRVRPVAGRNEPGAEDSLKFTVQPPWSRSTEAWVIYVTASASLLALTGWLSYYLPRRKNERLERLVAERTGELKTTNAQLGRQINETTEKSAALSVSEERYRALNSKLEDRVEKRTAELSLSNQELQQRELLFRLVFEHAPVGISWRRLDLGGIYHFNPTFGQILELPNDTLADYAHLATLVHPDDGPRQSEMDGLIATGKTDDYTLEERFVLKGGRLVWGLLSVAVIRDNDGRIIQEIGILEDISLRKQAEEELAATHKRLLTTSREAGMAEVATGVLHNVGNVLNSVNVSATLVADSVRHSKSVNIAKLAALFEQHRSDIAEFLTKDSRGKLIPGYLGTLAQSLETERTVLIGELDHLRKNVEHIKEIVAMQQAYARTSGVIETVSVTDMVEDALRINAGSLARHDVDTFRDYQERLVVTTEKHKVMQILINLVRNAKYACDESGRTDKCITVRTRGDGLVVRISIIDNGVGVPAKNLARIFNHGFTTRAKGHGFGLHSGAIAAKELGGSLNVQSEGPGLGATFILELPYKLEPSDNENSLR